ncbi:MAG: hypothetical protein KC492_19345, partial [Myxococcales bacterium]|nr:hypothetical protein [Myxococcales bacterium]
MRTRFALATLTLTLAVAPEASANGMLGHMYTSELAISHVQTPELKQLLLDHPDQYLNGSFLPDSGYAAGDGYGEIAHWSGFVQGYLTWIQQTYSPPYDQGPAAEHVAVLLGAASHGMADESFDILLYDRAALLDGDTNELDTGTDVWLVNDRAITYDPPLVIDADALSQVFGNFTNHQVEPQVIVDGMTKAKSAHALVKTVLAPGHQSFRDKYPWASKAYLNPAVPGSYPYNARVIANYWEQIWRRLNSNVSVDASLFVGIDPAPDGADAERYLALDHTSIDGWITLFSGHGLEGSSLDSNSIQLLDPSGNVVPYTLRVRGDAWAHTIQLKPDADVAPKVTYRVKVTPAATTLNGEHLAADYTAEVKTACAEGDEASCPEL